MSYKRYWAALAIVIIGSFAVLGGMGRKMISEAPPFPDVYTTDARSAEFMQSGTMQTLRWMRVLEISCFQSERCCLPGLFSGC